MASHFAWGFNLPQKKICGEQNWGSFMAPKPPDTSVKMFTLVSMKLYCKFAGVTFHVFFAQIIVSWNHIFAIIFAQCYIDFIYVYTLWLWVISSFFWSTSAFSCCLHDCIVSDLLVHSHAVYMTVLFLIH